MFHLFSPHISHQSRRQKSVKSFLRLIFSTVKLPNFFHQLFGENLNHDMMMGHLLIQLIVWSYSDDREGILHKKVEYEGDDTYEGEDRHPKINVKNLMEKQNTGYLALPNVLSSLCRIQLILGHISRMEIRTLSGFYSIENVCDCLTCHVITMSHCHNVTW